jgi:hypothetical protein
MKCLLCNKVIRKYKAIHSFSIPDETIATCKNHKYNIKYYIFEFMTTVEFKYDKYIIFLYFHKGGKKKLYEFAIQILILY